MKRALRRHQALAHMRRREDRNQPYADLRCPCWTDPQAMARFREQPEYCSAACCANPRRWAKGKERLTLQERRADR